KYLIIILLAGLTLNCFGEELIENPPAIILDSLAFGEETTLEIVSWNIQNFPKHKFTVQLSAEIIDAISPDVIALQEIQSDSAFVELLIALNELSEDEEWDGYRAFSDEWDLNLAFIYNKKVIEIENIFEIYQEEDYDYAFPRRPLIMEFKYGEEELILINNHFKAMPGKENELRRKEAVKKLLEYIKENYELANVVVVGDMNDHLTDDESTNVFQEILEDSDNFKFADWEVAVDSTADWSYPYWKYRGHIDHIIISNELFDEFAKETSWYKTIVLDRYMEGGEGARYSTITDHRPVGLKLYFQ
ncbi:endonuclease/exonuclease/phosphatase family protein, partial [Candidatus Cloacimonadota bacterium]